jgi:predicted ATP-dependent endonuclease of OLD family
MSTRDPKMLYLKSVKLSGYKTIRNLEAEFKPGLNIIIGKNAVGKTMFSNFLYHVLKSEYSAALSQFKSEIIIDNGSSHLIRASRSIEEKDDNGNSYISPITSIEVFENNEPVHFKETSFSNRLYLQRNLQFRTIQIQHGIPTPWPFLSNPVTVELPNSEKIFEYAAGEQIPFSSKILISNILSDCTGGKIKIEDVRDSVDRSLSVAAEKICHYTVIDEIRIADHAKVVPTSNDEKVKVVGVSLEFRIDDDWLQFEDLSDGLARLVYIILEMSIGGHFDFNATAVARYNDDDVDNLILLEEPELGIHPHQLHQLMLFIKEQSEQQQVILTTHSPQVLDILDPDELDRIHIAKYDREKGTTLHRLNKKQVAKAKKYMEEDFLSDYWRFSDLED